MVPKRARLLVGIAADDVAVLVEADADQAARGVAVLHQRGQREVVAELGGAVEAQR